MDQPVAQVIDAQPFLRPDPDSVWQQSNAMRDRIYKEMVEICDELGFGVLINRSPDFVYPNWVSLHAWLPTETAGVTRRVGLVVELHIVPQHRYEIIYLLKAFKNNKEEVFKFLISCDKPLISKFILYLLKDYDKPAWKDLKIRESALHLWMPKNKLKFIRTTMFPFKAVGWLASLAGLFLFIISTQGRTLIGDYFGVSMYNLGLLGQSATYEDLPRYFMEYGLAFLVPGIACLMVATRRKIYHMNSGRPEGQPRQLRTADSWSALLPGIGAQQDDARRRFIAALRDSAGEKRSIHTETISYVTPTGKREREQIVLTEGRAILFCHIYAYANDLLIGWDVHLNVGEWVEAKLVEGVHRVLHKKVILNTVVAGTAATNEYDLIDLNGLTDWAHTNLVRIVKQLISEHKLDEEIDFTIVRSERQSLLARPEQPAKRKSRFRPAG